MEKEALEARIAALERENADLQRKLLLRDLQDSLRVTVRKRTSTLPTRQS